METRHEGGRNGQGKELGKDVGSVAKPQPGELCSLHGPTLKLDPHINQPLAAGGHLGREVHLEVTLQPQLPGNSLEI